MFTVPTLKVGMVGGFTPVAEWGWAKNEEDVGKEIESIKVELQKLEARFGNEVRFEGWDLIHNEEEILQKSFEIQSSDVAGVIVFGVAVTVPYTHAFLTFNKPLIIFAKEFTKPFYGSNLENAFLAWKFAYEGKSRWVSFVTDSFDWLYEKVNAIRAVSNIRGKKVLGVGPVHQVIGGKPLGMGSYECIREAQEKLGLSFDFVSLDTFIERCNKTAISPEMNQAYAEFVKNSAGKRPEVKDDEALRAVRAYFVLKDMIKEKSADILFLSCYQGVLIDALGAAPCFAITSLNDEGIMAGCEADPNALINMVVLSHATNKPAFIGDPVFNERSSKVINAHCLCASRLKGFKAEKQPYLVSFHYESGRSLSQQTIWDKGEKVTSALLSPGVDTMIIFGGITTNSNMGYPACNVQVEFEVEDIDKLWKECGQHIPFIGHLVTVLGDHTAEVAEVCKLLRIEPIVV
jgi:hypothetical protein